MDQSSRIFLLRKIAISAGILTSFVENNLGPSNFKQQFLKTPEGPGREQLSYQAALAKGKPTNLVPVTVDGPNGIKITYKVTPDYLNVNGTRLTVAPSTVQRIADQWDMSLPTDKMSQQIYQAADTKVRAAPLSGSGYQGQDGNYYSGNEVAQNRIGKSDAALKYNELTDEAIRKHEKQTGKPARLIAGHGKDILQPKGNPHDVRIGGWHGADNTTLQPYSNTHKGEAQRHTEYGMYARLIDNKATVTYPDGRTAEKTLAEIQNDPELFKAISHGTGSSKYIV